MEKKLSDLLIQYRLVLALLAVAACIVTWYIDLAGYVLACPYCQVQRTMIGLLGIILLISRQKSLLLKLVSYGFAIFGLDIAGDQMFLSIKNATFPTINFGLSLGAFILIGILTYTIHIWHRK